MCATGELMLFLSNHGWSWDTIPVAYGVGRSWMVQWDRESVTLSGAGLMMQLHLAVHSCFTLFYPITSLLLPNIVLMQYCYLNPLAQRLISGEPRWIPSEYNTHSLLSLNFHSIPCSSIHSNSFMNLERKGWALWLSWLSSCLGQLHPKFQCQFKS